MWESPKSRINNYPTNKWVLESQLLKHLWLIASSVAIILSLWFAKPTFAWNKNSVSKTGQDLIWQSSTDKYLDDCCKMLASANFSEEQIAVIRYILETTRNNKKNWFIPNSCGISVKQVKINPKDYIWSLPAWTETLQIKDDIQTITRENYINIIGKLFNIDEINNWFDFPNWKPLTPEQKNKYLYKIISDLKIIWFGVLSIDEPIKEQFLDEWFWLYNKWVQLTKPKSIQVYREILISSLMMTKNRFPSAEMKNIGPEIAINILDIITRKTGYYVALTQELEISWIEMILKTKDKETRVLLIWWQVLDEHWITTNDSIKRLFLHWMAINNLWQQIQKIELRTDRQNQT